MAKTRKHSAKALAEIDLAYARKVIASEALAVSRLRGHINAAFQRAAELLLRQGRRRDGRVVGTGLGKAGIIAQKVMATLASTGTPALFMHPVEALHGDLGMLARNDIVLAFSNSGESDELLRLVPAVRKVRARIIVITGHPDSALGRAADLVLEIGQIREPCPLHLAPSASTTAMLALGDALALCVLKARGFTAADYAKLHPGGALGRKLTPVREAMRRGARLALVRERTPVGEALDRMSRARGGAAVVADAKGRLVGVFTDGDFRRLMIQDPARFNDSVGAHMTSPCLFIREGARVAEAQELMSQKRINALPVVDEKKKVLGLLDIQDIVSAAAR